MGTFSIWHWLVVGIVILLLFGGRNKLSSLMGDAARGITAFKKGLREGGDGEGKGREEPPKPIEADSPVTVESTARKDKAANG